MIGAGRFERPTPFYNSLHHGTTDHAARSLEFPHSSPDPRPCRKSRCAIRAAFPG